MAGTLKRRRGLYMQKESIVRELAIEHNKLIDDVETVRTQVAEYVVSGTVDPGGLADGAGETATLTVTGIALGDFVTGVSFDKDLVGITLTGYVCATNKAAARFQNESGASVDLASGTLRIMLASPGLADAANDLTAAKLGDSGGTAYSA